MPYIWFVLFCYPSETTGMLLQPTWPGSEIKSGPVARGQIFRRTTRTLGTCSSGPTGY